MTGRNIAVESSPELQWRALIAVLEQAGWQRAESRGPYAYAWQKISGGTRHRLLVPSTHEVEDLELAMLQAAKALREVSGVQIATPADLLEAAVDDVLEMRLAGRGFAESSSTPFEFLGLASSMYKLIEASGRGMAALHPSVRYRGRMSDSLRETIRGIRITPPASGSFRLTARASLARDLAQRELFPDARGEDRDQGAPRVRKLLIRLAESVDQLRRRLTQSSRSPYGAARALYGGVERGVSLNLCAAVRAALEEIDSDAELLIGVSWSPIIAPPRRGNTYVRYRRRDLDELRAFEDFLQKSDEPEEVDLLGFVKELRRPLDHETGSATMTVTEEGQRRRVELLGLTEAQHSACSRAHDQRQFVRVRGVMRVDGRTRARQVVSPESVIIDEDDADF